VHDADCHYVARVKKGRHWCAAGQGPGAVVRVCNRSGRGKGEEGGERGKREERGEKDGEGGGRGKKLPPPQAAAVDERKEGGGTGRRGKEGGGGRIAFAGGNGSGQEQLGAMGDGEGAGRKELLLPQAAAVDEPKTGGGIQRRGTGKRRHICAAATVAAACDHIG